MYSPLTQPWYSQFSSLCSQLVYPLCQFFFGWLGSPWVLAVCHGGTEASVLSVARQEKSEELSGSGHFFHWTAANGSTRV